MLLFMLQVVRTAKSVSTLSSITAVVGRLQIEDNSYFPYAVANWRSYLWLKYWNKLAETILIGGLYTRPIRDWSLQEWVCCHLVITPPSSGEKLAHDYNQVSFLTHLCPFKMPKVSFLPLFSRFSGFCQIIIVVCMLPALTIGLNIWQQWCFLSSRVGR